MVRSCGPRRLPKAARAGLAALPVVLAAGCVSGTALVSDEPDRPGAESGVDSTPDGSVDTPDEGSLDDSGGWELEGGVDDTDSFDADFDAGPDDGDAWEILPESCDRVFQSDVSCRYSGACPDGFRYCCQSLFCGDPPFPAEFGCCHDSTCGTGCEEHHRCEEALGDQIPMPDGCGIGTECPPERPYCCSSFVAGSACSDHELENWYSCVLTDGSADGGRD